MMIISFWNHTEEIASKRCLINDLFVYLWNRLGNKIDVSGRLLMIFFFHFKDRVVKKWREVLR